MIPRRFPTGITTNKTVSALCHRIVGKIKPRSTKTPSARSAICRTAWLLTLAIVWLLSQTTSASAQSTPATLPDLKLSKGGTVRAVVVQPDGKIVIGGQFTAVNAIAVNGDEVYVGGLFTSIGGANRINLAKVSSATGVADPLWNPSVQCNSQCGQANVCALHVDGTNLFVGGQFDTIGGVS